MAAGAGFAQQPGSLDWYVDRAAGAIEQEHYETAVEALQQGKAAYPDSPRLNVMLADLYYDKELYHLALQEYLEAQAKEGEQFTTLNQIARCYGKLGRSQEAVASLLHILELYPESIETYDDLGWMYFKTHQLERGEALLLGALDRFGPDRGLFMTLGTIYSGMYRYDSSRRYYLAAIEDALREGDEYFASVAYYNLSLLEHSFYHFNSALRYTEESLRMSDRAPGHLARGELYESRLELRSALADYEQAYLNDSTPLSKVNLALLYQQAGRLQLARRYAEEVLATRDLAWMYYYGTDRESHLKDVHEILADTFLGLAREELALPAAGPAARVVSWGRALLFRLTAVYHRQKFRLFSLEVGRRYLGEGNLLDAYWELYRAAEGYRPVARKYLRLAREIETSIVQHVEAHYDLEEGKLLRKAGLLKRSLSALDPFWEKQSVFEALLQLARLQPRGSAQRRRTLNRLYALNPGGMLQNGLGLPLQVEQGAGPGERVLRRALRWLRRAGSQIAASPGDPDYRYRLALGFEGQSVVARLTDLQSGNVLFRETIDPGEGGVSIRAARLARGVIEQLYAFR